MSPRLDSTRLGVAVVGPRSPALAAVAFVASVALLNGALNSLLAGLWSALAPSARLEYAVTVPVGTLGAGLLSVAAAVLAAATLAVFVRSVGETADSGLKPTPPGAGLRRLARAAVVGCGGAAVAAVGLALFVVPGVVVLVYLPFVFVAVALDGETVAGAIETSHDRVASRPLPAAATALGPVLALAALGLGGVVSSVLPPAVEFVAGGAGTALVVLGGTYLLTELYQRLPAQPAPATGRL
jgi:hypothetical protein